MTYPSQPARRRSRFRRTVALQAVKHSRLLESWLGENLSQSKTFLCLDSLVPGVRTCLSVVAEGPSEYHGHDDWHDHDDDQHLDDDHNEYNYHDDQLEHDDDDLHCGGHNHGDVNGSAIILEAGAGAGNSSIGGVADGNLDVESSASYVAPAFRNQGLGLDELPPDSLAEIAKCVSSDYCNAWVCKGNHEFQKADIPEEREMPFSRSGIKLLRSDGQGCAGLLPPDSLAEMAKGGSSDPCNAWVRKGNLYKFDESDGFDKLQNDMAISYCLRSVDIERFISEDLENLVLGINHNMDTLGEDHNDHDDDAHDQQQHDHDDDIHNLIEDDDQHDGDHFKYQEDHDDDDHHDDDQHKSDDDVRTDQLDHDGDDHHDGDGNMFMNRTPSLSSCCELRTSSDAVIEPDAVYQEPELDAHDDALEPSCDMELPASRRVYSFWDVVHSIGLVCPEILPSGFGESEWDTLIFHVVKALVGNIERMDSSYRGCFRDPRMQQFGPLLLRAPAGAALSKLVEVWSPDAEIFDATLYLVLEEIDAADLSHMKQLLDVVLCLP
jgi:hypothetical protein